MQSERKLQKLRWDTLDHLLAGQNAGRQKDLVGFRGLRTQINNMFAASGQGIKDEQYMHLPEVDGPHGARISEQDLAELKKTRDRLAALNAQKLAERAALQN